MSAEGEDLVDQPGWAVDQEHQVEVDATDVFTRLFTHSGTLPRSVYRVTSPVLSCSGQIPRHQRKKTKLGLAEEKYGRLAKKLKLKAKLTPSNIIMCGILPDIPLTASESQMRRD